VITINRKQFIGGMALLAATPAGCPTPSPQSILDELNTWVPVAIATFDGVVAAINPAIGSALALLVPVVDGEWKALSGAISTYIHTVPPPAAGLPTMIAMMTALESNMDGVIAALPPGLAPNILAASKAAYALLLATLISIQSRLQPTSTPSLRAVVSSVPPAKSAKDFANQINSIMKANGQALRVKA
jgi:hypothetical protein